MDYKTYLNDPHAAAFWRAIALRRLCSYRAAVDAAKQHGDDAAGLLIEPPAYAKIGDAYVELLEEFVDQSIDSTTAARAALDLLAAIAEDQMFGDIFQDGTPSSIERDRADVVRLLDCLSGWLNKHQLDEAMTVEREGRS
jgi:hypothetical protein